MAVGHRRIRRVDIVDLGARGTLGQELAQHGPGGLVVGAVVEPEQLDAWRRTFICPATHDAHALRGSGGSSTRSHTHTRCSHNTVHRGNHNSPFQLSFLAG